jgi:hypothetical protein
VVLITEFHLHLARAAGACERIRGFAPGCQISDLPSDILTWFSPLASRSEQLGAWRAEGISAGLSLLMLGVPALGLLGQSGYGDGYGDGG